MLKSSSNFIHKSRLLVGLSIGLFIFGIFSVIFVHSGHTNHMVDETIAEAKHDLEFFSKIIKKTYLKADYVEVENILNNWVSQNQLDRRVKLVAANGFELFSWVSDRNIVHSEQVVKNIMHQGSLLLTLTIERDVGKILTEAEHVKQEYITVGLIMASVFGVVIWVLLSKFAFLPLEKEIIRREEAEADLLSINEELESRVNERTAAFKKLSSVVQQTDDIVLITDPEGIVEYVNSAFEKITGYSSSEMIGTRLGKIKSGMNKKSLYKNLWETISSGKSFRDVIINRRKNGDIYYEEKTITPLKDDNDEIVNYVSTGKDISDQIEIQERLHHVATHDALTELPNRLMISDRLKHAINQSERATSKIAVLFIDLDHFKQINDSLGHQAGDSLLKILANKLQQHLHSGDTLGRFGGDEFVIVMEGIVHVNEVAVALDKILATISEPVLIGGFEHVSTASVGVTIFPDDADNEDTLLQNADVAMYRAKSRTGNTFEFYTKDMSIQADERMEMQHSLNHALERDEFRLFYQPKIDATTRQVTGMEALLRWEHPKKGLISPLSFIPILEETGKIVEVGHWVVRNACAFATELKNKGFNNLRVSVNLSAMQFHDENLLECLQNVCNEYGFDASSLEVEITESLLIEDIDQALNILDRIHSMGIHIAIDDFGTGYSSMSYLKRLPIQCLKIDKSFVDDIPDDKDDVAISQAIIALGQSLGLDIIAEGVETKQQVEFFTKYPKCGIQGFYFSKPLPKKEFFKWLIDYDNNSSHSKTIV